MKTANEIIEELNDLGSSLAAMPRVMPYSVPAGYFGNLPGNTLEMAIRSDVPNWSKAASYNVPQGYFAGLTSNILNAVKAEHITATSSKKMPFSVPAGYFEALPAQMLQAAKKSGAVKKETTRIPLGRPNPFRQIRWAAAAVLLICIGFGGYETFFLQPDYMENMLTAVPSNDIQDYLQHNYIYDVNRVVNSEDINKIEVDNKDIIQYLDETGWDMAD